MTMKTRELGLFWLKDHMVKAQDEMLRTKNARTKTKDGVYAQQMDVLIAAQQEVLSVWEKHVTVTEAIEKLEKADARKSVDGS